MAKKNTKPIRIDSDLADIISEIKVKNDLSTRQASKEVAKILKGFKIKKRELEF